MNPPPGARPLMCSFSLTRGPLVTFALAVMLIGSGVPTNCCQGESLVAPRVVGESLPENAVAQLQTQAQVHTDDMYDYLLLKIDELDRNCDLTPQQQARLKTAAKGAVDRAVTRWLETAVAASQKNSAMMQKQAEMQQGKVAPQGFVMVGGAINIGEAPLRGWVDINAAPFEGWAPVPGEVNFGGPAQVWIVNNAAGIMQFQTIAALPELESATVEEERLWKSAIESTLTSKQAEARRSAAVARAELPNNTLGDRVLAELDRVLLLDATQREEIAKSVGSIVGQSLRAPSNRQTFSPASLANSLLQTRPAEPMTRILSEQQLNYWKSKMKDTPPNLPAPVIPSLDLPLIAPQ